MADIHVLPVRTDNDTGHITTLLANAFADGVDLGPRGQHIKALALSLQQQVDGLRQMADEFRDIPVREMVGLDLLEAQLLRLSENMDRLAEMARNLDA